MAAVSEGSEGSTAEAESVAGAIGGGVESIVSDALAVGVDVSSLPASGSSSFVTVCNSSVWKGAGVGSTRAVLYSNWAGMLADAETYSWGASSLESESLSIMLVCWGRVSCMHAVYA